MSFWAYNETELWRCGQENVSIFHVFGVTAFENTVLAFAEARYGKGGDCEDPHDIWMRRSTDGGRTFQKSLRLLDCGGQRCFVNPTPLWDQSTRRVFLFYAENMQNTHTQNFVIHSDDGGETWSTPLCINPVLESLPNPPAFHLPGPGHGICLKNGRLLVPFWHRHQGTSVPAAQRGYCISTLFSDDHGATWQATPCIYDGPQLNETRLTQTATGVYWNIRTGSPLRNQCRSLDGGETWTPLCECPLPPAAVCDAACLGVQGKGDYADTVLVSHVSHPQKRQDMEICISTDGGETFTDRFQLPTGDAMPGYSDLCLLQAEDPLIGLVHCRNNHVLFSRISMQTLTGGKYDNTTRQVWNW